MAKREYEAPDLTAMLVRTANALVKRAEEGDLEAISALADAERAMHDALTAAVRANRAGVNAYSYAEIGRELGISKQAAAKRFA